MRTRSLKKLLPYEGFTKKKLNILPSPCMCRQRLQEHHDLLAMDQYDQSQQQLAFLLT